MAKKGYFPLLKKPYSLSNIYEYFNSIQFPKGYHGCFAVNSLTEQHIINSNEFKKVKIFFKSIEKSYFENLKASQETGEISKKVDLKALSKLFLSLDLGLAVYGIMNNNNRDTKAIIALLPNLLEI